MARTAKRVAQQREDGATARMRALYAAGNVKAARAAAWQVMNDASSGEAEREEARALRERSAIDPRALQIGFAALALGLLMTTLALLLR